MTIPPFDALASPPGGHLPSIADLAERLDGLGPRAAAAELSRLPHERAVLVLDRSEFGSAGEALSALPTERAARLLRDMSADRATDVLLAMEDDPRSRLLPVLEPEVRDDLSRLLRYRPDSAGGMMTTEFVCVTCTQSVAQTLDHILEVERSRLTTSSRSNGAGRRSTRST